MPYHCELDFPDTSLGPGSPECADTLLGRFTESHLRIHEQMIEVAITVQIEGEKMGVRMVSTQRLTVFVSSGYFRAAYRIALTDPSNDSAMEEFCLRKRPGAWWQ